jgi:ArsR family metal-binding transcriptional regulator
MINMSCVKRKPIYREGRPVQIWTVTARYTTRDHVAAMCEGSGESPAIAFAMALLTLCDAHGIAINTANCEPLDVYDALVHHLERLRGEDVPDRLRMRAQLS